MKDKEPIIMVFLDIETTTFFQDEHIKALPRDQQIAAMEFGIAVTIDSSEQSQRVWTKDQVVDLYNYLVWCGVEVCGWNIDAFDLPVIINNAAKAGWNTLEVEHETIRTLDLFAEIRQHTGRWYGLGAVSEATLKRSKLADGQKAAEWLRSGDPADFQKAVEYCTADVELVREMYELWLHGSPIILPPRAERGEINPINWWYDGGFERVPDATGAISTK